MKTTKATSNSYHELWYHNLKQKNFVLHFISACFNSYIIWWLVPFPCGTFIFEDIPQSLFVDFLNFLLKKHGFRNNWKWLKWKRDILRYWKSEKGVGLFKGVLRPVFDKMALGVLFPGNMVLSRKFSS